MNLCVTPSSPRFLVLVVLIAGFCFQNIGCDGIAGSQRHLDRCGVCGGDNSTCRVVSGIFTRPQLPVGYNLVAHIPTGACNVNITQLRKSTNYLALRKKDGAFIINGNWALNWPGDFEGAGTTFSYVRGDAKNLEGITSLGPLKEPLDLMVLSQQPNPGIKYEYTVQMDTADALAAGAVQPPLTASDQASSSRTIQSRVLQQSIPPIVGRRGDLRSSSGFAIPLGTGGSPTIGTAYDVSSVGMIPGQSQLYMTNVSQYLTKPLGSGSSSILTADRRTVVSFSSSVLDSLVGGSGGTKIPPTAAEHPHLHSHHSSSHHHQHRSRTLHHSNRLPKSESDRKFLWKVTGYTNCSEVCGGGTQRSIVRCVRSSNGVVVAERRCQLEDKPAGQSIRCNLKPCPAEWITGPWSACSESCGPNGFQSRTVHCQQRVSATFTMRVAEGACLEERPEAKKGCFVKPCHQWTSSAWSQCSTPCGNGVRSRKVKCIDASGTTIADKDCTTEEKPVEISACNMGPCEGVDWFMSDWSIDCSENCGTGLQTRHVVCSGLEGVRKGSKFDPAGNEVDGMISDQGALDEYRCDQSRKPAEQRECVADRYCGEPVWFTGPWSQCSATCGDGLRTRQVLCLSYSRGKFKIVEHGHCSSTSKPEDTSPCQHPNPCPPRWFASDWSECSVSCGGGIQKRSVSCRATNYTLSSSLCVDASRPVDRRSCNEVKCDVEGNRLPFAAAQTSQRTIHVADAAPTASAGPSPTTLSREDAHKAHQQNKQGSQQNVSAKDGSSAEMQTDAEVSDGECSDQYRNCALVVQARLCRYKYYRAVCCSACSDA